MEEEIFAEEEETSTSWASNFIGHIISSVSYTYENYGWYIFIGSIILLYIYNKKLNYYIKSYKAHRAEEEYIAKYHKNPNLLRERLEAQQKFVSKLQEQYEKDAEEYKRRQEEKEARKREEMLKRAQEGGSRLGSRDSHKPEYNPLNGGGSCSTYRPTRRKPCSGGGCG